MVAAVLRTLVLSSKGTHAHLCSWLHFTYAGFFCPNSGTSSGAAIPGLEEKGLSCLCSGTLYHWQPEGGLAEYAKIPMYGTFSFLDNFSASCSFTKAK